MMKKLQNHLIGVDQGEITLFSDFEDNGEMWTGHGERERRKFVSFSEPFMSQPVVQVGISMWDVHNETSMRANVSTQEITAEGFDLVFSTWSDTRVARIRVSWTAIGELKHANEWDV